MECHPGGDWNPGWGGSSNITLSKKKTLKEPESFPLRGAR